MMIRPAAMNFKKHRKAQVLISWPSNTSDTLLSGNCITLLIQIYRSHFSCFLKLFFKSTLGRLFHKLNIHLVYSFLTNPMCLVFQYKTLVSLYIQIVIDLRSDQINHVHILALLPEACIVGHGGATSLSSLTLIIPSCCKQVWVHYINYNSASIFIKPYILTLQINDLL